MLGIIVNLIWQGCAISCILTLLAILPADAMKLKGIQSDILGSNSYELAQIHCIRKIPVLNNMKRTIDIFGSPDQLAEVQNTYGMQQLLEHPKIKTVLSDKETIDQIANKKIFKLLENQKIKAVIDDEELMKRFTHITQDIYKQKIEEIEEEKDFWKDLEEVQ